MRRFRLFEVLDQPWCPRTLREGATDCLEAITNAADPYRPVREQAFAAIRRSGTSHVIDLCSGGGGPWLSKQWLAPLADGMSLCVTLTDKFPSRAIVERLPRTAPVTVLDLPVDAIRVPANLRGFRTIFSSLHHFPDAAAAGILSDAVQSREGFASAEITARSPRAIFTMFLLPFFVWRLTPAMRPFRWSRLIFTYLLPLIPLIVLWDGVISCLRTRTPEELSALIRNFPDYDWSTGYARDGGAWLPPVYLIGLPKENV